VYGKNNGWMTVEKPLEEIQRVKKMPLTGQFVGNED
jgi:hypothetical protein